MGNASKTNATNPTNPNNAFSESGGVQGSSGVQNPDQVWGAQAPFLQDLYQQGQTALAGSGQQQQQAQGLYNTAAGTLQGMQNPGISPQLAEYQRAVQQNLTDNILPTIGGQAGMAGQMGGSRQGVAQGLGIQRANQDITGMAANLYNQDQNRAMAAAGMTPSLGAFGQQIPWYALNQYAGILGSPTVLGQGGTTSSFGETWGSSSDTGGGGGGGGGGWTFGINSPKVVPKPGG